MKTEKGEMMEQKRAYDDEIDLRELLKTIWQKKVLIALVTILTTLIGGGYAFLKNPTPLYQGTLHMEIGEIQNDNFGSRPIENTNDLAMVLSIELGAKASLKRGSTRVIEISVAGTDQSLIKTNLDQAKEFVLDRHTQLSEFYKDKIMTKEIGKISISGQTNKPKRKLIVAVASVTGFVLSIFLVFFIEFIRSFKEEENYAKK